MSNDVYLNPYFERIGFAGSIAPTLLTLSTLHALHPAAIPFENLDPLSRRPVPLDQKSLNQKLLADRRGGFCFEHNLMFMRVLRELEFTVRGYAAQVLWGHPEGAVRPTTHMVLAVEVSGVSYLADVGFGGLTLTAPLKLKTGVEQQTPHESFRLTGGDPTYTLEALIGADWRPVYAFDPIEHSEDDYVELNAIVTQDPRFADNLIAARSEPGRRHGLFNTTLSTHVTGAETERRTLASVDEIKEVLTEVFGIALPVDEALDAALARLVPAEADA